MTARRPNKRQRLSTSPATLAFNDYSDYEGAPESSDFRALPHRLSTLRLCPQRLWRRQTHPRKPRRSDQGRPPKEIGWATPNTPAAPPATPGPGPAHGGPRSPQAGALAARYASPTATGTAHRGPRETPCTAAEGAQTPHASAGRAQDERKINPGEFTPGKRKCSTEPPRRRHVKRAGGRQQGSKTPRQGRTPARAKRKPAGSVAPGGFESLKQGLEHGPAKNNDVYDQHGCTSSGCPPLLRISPATASLK